MSEEEEQNRFSLRKLSIGLASVLVGVSIFGTSQTVKADTVANNQTSSVTSNAQSSDTQENKNAVKSSFSNDNQANNAKSNLIQTQVEAKKDQKQDSVPKTQEVNDSSNLDAEKSIVRTSSLQEPDNQSNNHAEDNSQTQLNITKNSQQLDQKELATNLTQDNSTQNNDWTDPAKQGFHKTTAGWTKLQQGKDYDAVANTQSVTTSNPYQSSVSNDVFDLDYSINIQSTVSKNDIKSNSRILLASIPLLNNKNHNMHFEDGGELNKNNTIFDNKSGITIGTVKGSIRNDEIDLILQIANTKFDVAQDIKLNYTHHDVFRTESGINPPNSMPDSSADDIYKQILVLPQGKNIEIDYTKHVDKLNFVDPSSVKNPFGNVGVGAIRIDTTYNAFNVAFDPEKGISRVFQFKPLSNDSNFKLRDYDVIPSFYLRNADGKVAQVSSYHWCWKNYEKKADNLSAAKLMKATSNRTISYSKQADGSLLVYVRVDKNTDTYPIDQIEDSFKTTFSADNHGLATTAQNAIVKTSTDYAKSRNGLSEYAWIPMYFSYNEDKPVAISFSDVTPNVTPIMSPDIGKHTPDGMTGIDTSFYKTINVKFEDNQDDIFDSNYFNTITGTDLTYNIKSADDPTFNSQTNIVLPPNVLLADDQPTSVHYGIIKDSNPDIVIKIKHLVKVVSGDIDLDLYPNIKKALNSDARRTITFHYPANSQGNNPSQIVQSVHFIRSGKADFTTDTVDTSTLTQWNVVVSTAQGVIIKDGKAHFAPLTIKDLPHINGYKAHVVRSKVNPAVYMVSFMAVPSAVKPSLPNEEKPSTPTKQPETPVTPVIPDNPNWDKLDHKVVDVLNQSDSGWTMPENNSTYTVEVPDDAIIDLSDLVIAEPVHAQTRTQIRVTKRFKLSKKHSIKHLKHRKKAVRTFRKYRL